MLAFGIFVASNESSGAHGENHTLETGVYRSTFVVHKVMSRYGQRSLIAEDTITKACVVLTPVYLEFAPQDQVVGTVEIRSYNSRRRCYSARITKVDQVLHSRLHRILYDGSSALGFGIAATVFGVKTAMPEEIYTRAKQTGIAHLFAISGLHFGILTGVLWFVSALFVFLYRRYDHVYVYFLRLLVVCAGCVSYGWLIGAHASVVRSLLFVLCLFWMPQLTNIRVSKSTILSFLFLCVAVANLDFWQQLGFQLSFWVAFVLIVFVAPVQSVLLRIVFFAIAPTIVAGGILGLYGIESSILSVVNNIYAIPIFSVLIFPVALFGGGLQFLMPDSSVVLILSDYVDWALQVLARVCVVYDPHRYEYFIFVAVCVALVYGVYRQRIEVEQ